MNLREKYKIERIIGNIVRENKDKPLNEIKKMVKEELRQEEERGEWKKNISSKVGIDEIIEVIKAQRLLREEKQRIVIEEDREGKQERNKER